MRVATVALTALLFAAGPAWAQLRDCDHSHVGSPKVFLDRVRVPTPTGPTTTTFADRVARRLRQRLKAVMRRLAVEGGANLVECPVRMPSGPGDFTVPIQNHLFDQGVILEVWSRVDSTETDDDRPAYEAEIQWVAYPLCHSTEAVLPGKGFFAPPARLTTSQASAAVESLLVSENELYAHALLGLGVAELNASHYADAYRLMRKARCLLPDDGSGLGARVDGWLTRTLQLASAANTPLAATVLTSIGTGGCP